MARNLLNVRFRQFFDRKPIMRELSRTTRRVLSKAGAFVRQRARTSIRKRKGVSAPGRPPSSHEGSLRRGIFFGYEAQRESVVVGPRADLGPQGKSFIGPTVPEILEFGGSVRTKEDFILVPAAVGRNERGQFESGGLTRVETGGRLTYQARPFMGPALEAEKDNFAEMWRDSIKG